MQGPLSGIRIVEASTGVSAPLATMILADQGADVVKVEQPGLGDRMRFATTMRRGISSLFVNCNRSKRSIAINLRIPSGRDVLYRLVRGADVFVQNFRPGVAARLGITEAEVREHAPDVIYVSISGFGETGPLSKLKAYDHVIQGYAGFAALQGAGGRKPALMHSIVADKVTSYAAAQAITAALFARPRGGGGQHVRLNMLDTAIAFLWPDGMMNGTFLEEDDELFELPNSSDYYDPIATSDGHVAVFAVSDRSFERLCQAVERPDWRDDGRFSTLGARVANPDAFLAAIADEFTRWKTAPLMERLQSHDIASAPIVTLADVPHTPQVVHNQTLIEHERPHVGRVREPRPAVQFSRTPARIRSHAPGLGEHSRAILTELGYASTGIAELIDCGSVASMPGR